MPTKQPVPPPKFAIGQQVWYKDTVYYVESRTWSTHWGLSGWRYQITTDHPLNLSENNDNMCVVMENSLKPVLPPPKFKLGDKVIYSHNGGTVIKFKYSDRRQRYEYTIEVAGGRLFTNLPESSLVLDEPYNPPPASPKFAIGDRVIYGGPDKDIVIVRDYEYNFNTQEMYYSLDRFDGSMKRIDQVHHIPESSLKFWLISADAAPPSKLPIGDPGIVEKAAPLFKPGDLVRYSGRVWIVKDIILSYQNQQRPYYYDLAMHDGTTLYNIGESMLQPHTPQETKPDSGESQDNQTVVNEQGGKQSYLGARFDCIPPVVLRLLAQCLGFGARKYGKENWKNIPQWDHLNHAMNHINEWNRGNRDEPHLVNAMARLTFALWQAVDSKNQPETYIHPDDHDSTNSTYV